MIIREHDTVYHSFKDIRQGNVFRFNNKYYLKMCSISTYNAVCLHDGNLATLELDTAVIPVVCELVIK